jgi:hypothetical protein
MRGKKTQARFIRALFRSIKKNGSGTNRNGYSIHIYSYLCDRQFSAKIKIFTPTGYCFEKNIISRLFLE